MRVLTASSSSPPPAPCARDLDPFALFCRNTKDSEWFTGRFYQECESESDLSPFRTEVLSSEDWVGILCCESRAEQVR